ncbi:hypothetical protein LIA77_03489 [Sarocladium implicatum]|nr:hypothetical protein LIA77_03489 [Sarocladium implicatum]
MELVIDREWLIEQLHRKIDDIDLEIMDYLEEIREADQVVRELRAREPERDRQARWDEEKMHEKIAWATELADAERELRNLEDGLEMMRASRGVKYRQLRELEEADW